MCDFEEFYETLTGHREGPFAMPGVVNIAEEGSAYSRAYKTLMDARISLTRRFGMDFEDKDLERIMEAVAVIEKEVARGVFQNR
jgi:hypothetical protein